MSAIPSESAARVGPSPCPDDCVSIVCTAGIHICRCHCHSLVRTVDPTPHFLRPLSCDRSVVAAERVLALAAAIAAFQQPMAMARASDANLNAARPHAFAGSTNVPDVTHRS